MATYTTNLDLKKPAQSDKIRIADINNNMDTIDGVVGDIGERSIAAQIGDVEGALAIVSTGNVHGAITSGQYVYIKNHDTLDDGLYVATTNISANGTLSSSNVTADSAGGGLNALNGNIANLLTPSVSECEIADSSHRTVELNRIIKVGKVVHITLKLIAASGYEMTNSVSFTVPSGFRPASQVFIPLLYKKGGAIELGTGSITSDGNGWQNYTSSGVQQIFIDTEYVVP